VRPDLAEVRQAALQEEGLQVLIQATQNRDGKALQLKLDELIRAQRSARNVFADLEHASEAELERFEEGVPGVAPPWPSDRERGAQGGGSAGLTVYRSGAMRERSWTNLWVSRRRVSSSGARRSELGWTVAIT